MSDSAAALNQSRFLLNTSSPDHLALLVAANFRKYKCNVTRPNIYQPAGGDVARATASRLTAHGLFLLELAYRKGFFLEVHKCHLLIHKVKWKRMIISCKKPCMHHGYPCFLTSFLHFPSPHSFHFFSLMYLMCCKVDAGWYEFLTCCSSSSKNERKREQGTHQMSQIV